MKRINFKKLTIGIVLFFSWTFISAVYIYSGSNITVIQTNLNNDTLTKKTFTEFLKGEKITGEFRAKQNYLGQVLVRFYNYDRINKDSVIFRLKEKGQSSWYYENIYKTDQFMPNALFTFGFPIIADTKGKTYQFEIESVNGKPEDAVTLSSQNPITAAIYQYPKGLLVKNRNILSEFARGKINNTKVDRDSIVALITYADTIALLLLLEYMLITQINRKTFSLKRFNSSYVIITGLIVLIGSAVLYSIKKISLSESLAVLSFFILTLGVLISLIDSRKRSGG